MLSVIQKTIVTNISSQFCIARLAAKSKPKRENDVNFSTGPAVYRIRCPNLERGLDYLRDPRLNKGLAFTLEERQVLGIQGLLAANFKTQEQQVEICELSIDRYNEPLNKYLYLSELLDTNERLFYSVLHKNVEKLLPIVYTPTVGLACQKFGITYKKNKGLFVTIQDKCRIRQVLKNWPGYDVRAICVTDGERILGLGDLGAYGMGIPIGKLCLYTALAGIKPQHCMPVTLDMGTDNETLLVDPLYIGLRQKRTRGKEYDEFVDEFMQACVERFGRNVLIQFEDFALGNATRLLAKYKKSYCTFNDDVQGTAGVVVAGILAAVKFIKVKLSDQVYLFLGAGSAGIGIADLLVDAMVVEGVSKKCAQSKIFLFDADGFLSNKRPKGIPIHAKHYGKDMPPSNDFAKAVKDLKATCLIGVSTVGGAFTPAILKQMAANAKRPMIFALSNPTSKAECTAQAAYDNTEGRCIFASGSPFPPVKYNGKVYMTGQGNNSYVFPGLALGVISARIAIVTDHMFLTAAQRVASMVTAKDFEMGRIYPSLGDIQEISINIAQAVVEESYKHNLAGVYPKPKNMRHFVEAHTYDLCYPCYVPDFYSYTEGNTKIKTVKEIAHTHISQSHT